MFKEFPTKRPIEKYAGILNRIPNPTQPQRFVTPTHLPQIPTLQHKVVFFSKLRSIWKIDKYWFNCLNKQDLTNYLNPDMYTQCHLTLPNDCDFYQSHGRFLLFQVIEHKSQSFCIYDKKNILHKCWEGKKHKALQPLGKPLRNSFSCDIGRSKQFLLRNDYHPFSIPFQLNFPESFERIEMK